MIHDLISQWKFKKYMDHKFTLNELEKKPSEYLVKPHSLALHNDESIKNVIVMWELNILVNTKGFEKDLILRQIYYLGLIITLT